MMQIGLRSWLIGFVFVTIMLGMLPLSYYALKTISSSLEFGTQPQIEESLTFAIQKSTGDETEKHASALKTYRQRKALKPFIKREIIRLCLISVTAVALLSIILTIIFVNKITKPLRLLTKATDSIHKGFLEHKIPEQGTSEVRTLIRSFNDMSADLKKTQAELLRAERMQTWQQVARTVAHEIKNPLTPIKLSTERLFDKYINQSPDFDKVIKSATQVILSEIGKMEKLVDAFHRYARLPKPNLAPASLNPLLEEVMTLYESQLQEGTLTTRFAEGLPLVSADQDQLKQVFINLIKNALESIPSEKGQIHVATTFEGQSVVTEVSDNGSGIKSENISRIFQPYFTTKSQGNGLGLALADRIITEHGGQISVQSSEGQGATFYIKLPALQ